MFSTLDILLMNREKMGSDLTEEWEFELARQEKPKLKFPLKVIEADLDKVELGFVDPIINEPKKKKEDKRSQEAKVIDLPKKRNPNKKDKSKLF